MVRKEASKTDIPASLRAQIVLEKLGPAKQTTWDTWGQISAMLLITLLNFGEAIGNCLLSAFVFLSPIMPSRLARWMCEVEKGKLVTAFYSYFFLYSLSTSVQPPGQCVPVFLRLKIILCQKSPEKLQ